MDLSDPLKPETLRPFVSIVVPGLIAVLPFVLLLGYYVPAVNDFWGAHETLFVVLVAASVLAVGFMLSDVGELIEVHAWDPILRKNNANHDNEWHAYLKLQLSDEIIAQRFLRTKLTQFKFELAMVPALVLLWLGLLWYQFLMGIWTAAGFFLFSLTVFGVAAYLTWESWNTAQALASARQRILEAIADGPKGISAKAKEVTQVPSAANPGPQPDVTADAVPRG